MKVPLFHTVIIILLITWVLINYNPSCWLFGRKDDAESAKIVVRTPYLISLRWDNEHICGGSIISQRHILTAATCVHEFVNSSLISNLSIHAGTNFLNETGDAYDVEKIITHANYSTTFLHNDIGLLHLKKNIEFKETVQPISLVTTNHFVEVGQLCLLSGWGRHKVEKRKRKRDNNMVIPNELQKFNLNVFSQTECKHKFCLVSDNHICTFSQEDQTACHSDFGNPLVSKSVQIGIVTFIQSCATGYPNVYTRVSAFKEWIDQHTKL